VEHPALTKVVNYTGPHGLFLRLTADPRELAAALAAKEHRLPFALELQGTAQAALSTKGTVHQVDVTAVDGTDWHVQLAQTFGDLQEGATYTIRFRAKADAPRQVQLYARIAEPDWHGIGLNEAVPLTTYWKDFRYKFQAQHLAAGSRIEFNVGQRTGTVWIADFTVTKDAK